MKQVYLFVEGLADVEFLRRVLPPELLIDVEIVNAGGGSEILSLARSVIVLRRKPVAVVMDAESIDPDTIEERRASTEELIRAVGASIPIKVVAAAPEIEAWLFAAPEAIARALGASVSDEMVFLGKRDPSGVLQQLAEKNQTKWDTRRAVALLETQDIGRIRAVPEVSELCTFLKRVQQGDKAA